MHCCLSKRELVPYIDQGIIKSLTDLIEDHSVHYKGLLDTFDGLREYVTAYDGGIYMLAVIRTDDILEETYGNNAESMWINALWLNNLGLDMPATVDEFFDVMVASRIKMLTTTGIPTTSFH